MMKKLSFMFFILLAACYGGPGERDPNPLHLPPQGFVGDSIQGKTLYSLNCQVCHGSNDYWLYDRFCNLDFENPPVA